MSRIINLVYAAFAYLLCFGLTLAAVHSAEKTKDRMKFVWYSVIAVLIPSIFAGLRGLNVGTDVLVYAYPQYLQAANFSSLGNYIDSSGLELGYSVLVYICNHGFGSFQVLLGLTALMQVMPIYFCCMALRDRYHMTTVMLVFLCLFYIPGFNVMRQSVAAAWLISAFVYIYCKKYIKSAFAIIMAFLFHSTTIIGILFIALAIVFMRIKRGRLLTAVCAIFFIIFVVLMRYWNILVLALGNLGFLSYDKIANYSRVFTGDASSYMLEIGIAQYVETVFKVLFILVPLAYRKKMDDKFYNVTVGTWLIGVLVYLYFIIVFHTSYGYRISMYAEYYLVLLLPTLMQRGTKKCSALKGQGAITYQLNRMYTLRQLIAGMLVLLNWLILFALLGTHGTYPFQFFFE